MLPAQAAPPSIHDLRLSTPVPKAEDAERLNKLVTATKPAPEDRLGQRDRLALGRARAAGQKTVTALVATDRGAASKVEQRLTALGATVGYRNHKLGYLRVLIPTTAVERSARVPGIYGVDLNEAVAVPDPGLDPAPARAAAASPGVKPPGRTTSAVNPYLPTHEIGATDFVRRHPAWDGRGVTIGVLDTGVDLDHPALSTTSTGQRKILDWVTATDPLIDGDRSWRPMLTAVAGPRFAFDGQTWTAPTGDLRVNSFAESVTQGSELAGDVNRDGDTTDTWGVLYRPADHAIWVDTDQDEDFTDEVLRQPYRESFQVGHLGRDNPSTAVRESMPFVVEFRDGVDLTPAGFPGETADFVNIGIVSDSHGSHVAGIAAGNNLFGGAMDGAAPGARIVSARACAFAGGCTNSALSEGLIDLVANRGVDVVNISIGSLPALNDGNNVRAELYNRLIADFGVQLFISAGNEGPGVNTVGDPSVATNAVSVAASVSKETFLANYGARVAQSKALFNFSSRGPREDGGLKPDLSAPGAAVSTTPLWLPGVPVLEAGYQLPPGYSMFNGTSMAAPQAAGGAALLLSAGRAADVPITSAQLRTAIRSSAKFDRGLPASAQGVGRLQVPGAWLLLRRDARLVPGRLEVRAPVCSALSPFLDPPNGGAGIYNRCAAGKGGQRAGQTKTYRVSITRRSGRAGSRVHTLRWLGNDGTFSAPTSVRLPLNKAVVVPVKARPKAGAHSAILRINDTGTLGTDGYLSAVIVVGAEPQAPTFSRTASSRVDRFGTKSYFVTVPEGARVLKVNLSGLAAGSQTRFLAFHPYGVGMEDSSTLNCYPNRPVGEACNPLERTYEEPAPGVWEISVEARRTTPFLRNPFTLTTAVQGVSVLPELTTVASAAVGQTVPLSWSLLNGYGPVRVKATGGELGSARAIRPSITNGARDTYALVVPAGAKRLDVAIDNPSDQSADLDLYVRRDGVLVGLSGRGDSTESVTIANPAAGSYEVEVVGYNVPAGETSYDYRDVFYGRSLGSLDVTSPAVLLGNQEEVVVNGSITPGSTPETGRQLFGEVTLTEPSGAVVGKAGVTVERVLASRAARSELQASRSGKTGAR
jgi:subtilisin family serine protease